MCECVRACASTYTQDLCTSLTWGDDCAGVTLGRKASSLGFAGAGPTWGRAWAPLEWMMKMRAKPPLRGTPFSTGWLGFCDPLIFRAASPQSSSSQFLEQMLPKTKGGRGPSPPDSGPRYFFLGSLWGPHGVFRALLSQQATHAVCWLENPREMLSGCLKFFSTKIVASGSDSTP